MVRTAAGTMVPAQVGMSRKVANRRFLICIQYFDGDKEEAEDLGLLISELERIRNRDADVLIFGRADAQEYSRTVRDRLSAKFNKVMFERCRRNDAKSYPFGANAMFYDMVTKFAQTAPWPNDYFAFIPLEADCVPTRPGWIAELSKAYRMAELENKSAIGFVHDDPVRHLNGVAVYAIDIWRRVGTHKLTGGNPQVPYDIYHANNILPHAESSPLIKFKYRQPTITADELFGDNGPAVYHGVKDSSAREAVRARYITGSEQRDLSNKTVFTFSNPTPGVNVEDEKAQVALWSDGWRSRGWNPIVLTMRDAKRHALFREFYTQVEKLPMAGEKEAAMNRFIRWLALDTMGGGLMVDSDVLPGNFRPESAPDRKTAVALASPKSDMISMAVMPREVLKTFIEALMKFDPEPGVKWITDSSAWTGNSVQSIADDGSEGHLDAELVRFHKDPKSGEKIVVAMERFLRGT